MALTQQQYQQLAMWMGSLANWQALTDAQVAAAYGVVYTPVPYVAFQTAVMTMAAWGSVRLAGANLASYAASPQLQAAILTAIDLFTNYKGATVDESLTAFQAAMSGLVAAGIVTAQDQAAILALGQTYAIPGVTSIESADATTARQILVGQAASASGRVAMAAGYNAAVASYDAFDAAVLANPATAVAPTPLQTMQTFAAAVAPGDTVTLTPQGD